VDRLKKIELAILTKNDRWVVDFRLVDRIEKTSGGKSRPVVNETHK